MIWTCDEKRGTLRRKEGLKMEVQGRRKRGRPNRRWLDKVKDDIKEKGLSADEMYDRTTWMCRPYVIVSTPRKSGNKMKEKRKTLILKRRPNMLFY